MSRDKQLSAIYKDLDEIFDEEYKKRFLITPQNTAERMAAKGYRKSTDLAEEIFAEIDKIVICKVINRGEIVYDVTDKYAELKKKYTER